MLGLALPSQVITISSSDDDEPTTLQRSRLADTSKHHTAQPSLPSTGARSAITIPTYGTLPLPTRPVEDEPVTVAPEETMSLATRQNLAKLKQLEEDMKAMQRDLEQDVPSPEPAPIVRRPARRAFVPLAPIVLQPVQPRAAPAEPDDDISAPALAPDADANKITVVLKHKHGEQKIRIKQTDTATKLLHTFLKALDQLKPSWPRPKDVGACKLMFDGDKISPDTTIEDVGIEHGEIFDVSWK